MFTVFRFSQKNLLSTVTISSFYNFELRNLVLIILMLIFLEQFCPRGKGAMRLSLYEAPTQGQHTLGVVTARVRYVPSGSLTSHRINCEEL